MFRPWEASTSTCDSVNEYEIDNDQENRSPSVFSVKKASTFGRGRKTNIHEHFTN